MISILILFGYVVLLVVSNYVIISFLEHLIHRYLMHQKILPKMLYRYSSYLEQVFFAHALGHHKKWYKVFNFEPDPKGKEENLKILLVDTAIILCATTPIAVVWMWIAPAGAVIYILMVFIHNRLWGVLHREMHIPSGAFFVDWAIYKYLARYHFLHHQQVGKNFNVVFPLADFCLGYTANPKLRDIRGMIRLNLF